MGFNPDDAIPLEELRASGIDAYARLHAAVGDAEGRDRWLSQAPRGEHDRLHALAAGLPPPAPALPLWVLTALAVHAAPAFDAVSADETEPPGRALVGWRERHDPQLDYLLLTPQPAADAPWASWRPTPDAGGRVDRQLLARHVADVRAVISCDWWAAAGFVIVRDWFVELLPLLRALSLSPDRVVLDARAWLDDEAARRTTEPRPEQLLSELTGRASAVVERYAEWLDRPVPALHPDSAWAALLVLGDSALRVPASLRATLGEWDRVLAALRETSTASTAGYRPSATVSTDFWTTDDTLGYDLYADAIAEFICHPDTRPPLTIGIKAPWGAGKTSLMRMVRERLDPGANRAAPALVKVASSAREAPVTNRDALRWTAPDAGADRSPTPFETTVDGDSRRATVWFNPWAYQSGEHLWAGMAQAIIDGVTERMTPVERERFWFELNVRRVDPAAVRHRIHRLLVERLLPVAVAGGLLGVVGLLLLLMVPAVPAAVAGGLSIASLAAAGAGAAVRAGRYLHAGVRDSVDALVRRPDYEADAGALHLVHADMRRVLDLVADPDRPLVVFVDDLDRCSADVVGEVIEALNLFLAGQYPNCVFVLALEPDVVAAHLEAGRANLLEVLADHLPAGTHFGMGWRFLDKMVQLPLRLPAPEPAQLDVYIDSVLGRRRAPRRLDASAVHRRAERLRAQLSSVEDLRAAAQAVEQAEAGDAGRPEAGGTPASGGRAPLDEETIRAAELTLAERLRDDAPEVGAVVRSAAGLLSRNPREVKRFINLFRFYAFVQMRRELRDLPAPTLAQVGKMAILAIRWPYLLSVLGLAVPADRMTTVLGALEQAAAVEDTWAEAVAAAGLRPKMQLLLAADDDLRHLLARDPPLADAVGFL